MIVCCKRPIKVHLEICFNVRSVLLDFQSFTEIPVFERTFAHTMILFLSHLVKTLFIASEWYMQISCEMVCNVHVHQQTVSL